MGAIADAFVAFAQPLLDQTDGSIEEMNKALSIAQLCYNLALLPEDSREKMIQEMQQSLEMDATDCDLFRNSVIEPMLQRHAEMFPGMGRSSSGLRMGRRQSFPMEGHSSRQAEPIPAALTKKRAVTDPYGPCPCNSGKKYKFCCGRKAR